METNLKTLRLSTKLNQTDYGKMFNLTQGTYSNYENGTTQPDLELLVSIADYHNVSLDYVVGRTYPTEFVHLSDEEKIILSDFRQLTDYNKAKIMGETRGILISQN